MDEGSRYPCGGRSRRTLPGLVVLLACIAVLAQAVPAHAAGPVQVRALRTLSNLTTVTRWAYPQWQASAYQYPGAHGRVVGHLAFLTSEGQAALYLELRSAAVAGRSWILVPLPGRPNGVQGWVPASALGEGHVTHEHLVVNREALRITLYRAGTAVFSAPVGVGRPALPTPTGHFYVTEKLVSAELGSYGAYALGTSAYAPTLSEWPGGGIVGIHGTDEPQLIPGRPSHGCIRLRNWDISRLWQLVEVGTPLEIV